MKAQDPLKLEILKKNLALSTNQAEIKVKKILWNKI